MDAVARAPRAAAWLLLGVAALLALTACSTAARGEPALPAALAERGVVDADANVIMMLAPDAPVVIPGELFGDASAASLGLVSIEAAANAPPDEFAARFEFTSEAAAKAAHELVTAHGQQAWADLDGRFLAVAASDGAWATALREAWASDARAKLSERHPDEWEALRLLPEQPPSPPIAAGFARNLGDLLDAVLDAGEIEVPGLSSALGLVRVDHVAFAAYAGDLSTLPSAPTRDAIAEAGAGIIAVAESSYPGFVINFLAARFKERAGMEEVSIGDRTVFHRTVEGDVHLMAANFGSAFFLAAAPSRGQAEALMESVIASQEARS